MVGPAVVSRTSWTSGGNAVVAVLIVSSVCNFPTDAIAADDVHEQALTPLNLTVTEVPHNAHKLRAKTRENTMHNRHLELSEYSITRLPTLGVCDRSVDSATARVRTALASNSGDWRTGNPQVGC